MTKFDDIQANLDCLIKEISGRSFTVQAYKGEMTSERYQVFLRDLYFVVKHFCPVMLIGASRCRLPAVREFLVEHWEEEYGHEKWVLNDCLRIGGSQFADDVASGWPSLEVQALNGFNYGVAHTIGESALGMVLGFELIAARLGGMVSGKIQEALQLNGDEGVTFLRSHGQMDHDHLEELRPVIESIDDDSILREINRCAQVNLRMFSLSLI